MPFTMIMTPTADAQLDALKLATQQREKEACKAVSKALRFLANDPRHGSLKTHEYDSMDGPAPGVKVWEAYAENDKPQAYRIFWSYHPKQGEITILAITPHP